MILKILKISIYFLTKYLSYTNLYVKFKYFEIHYSNLYAMYYFIIYFEKFNVYLNFNV